MSRHHLQLSVLLIALGSAAIGCTPKVEISNPLLDAEHAPLVSVERRVLSNPRSVEHNRLVRGWRFVPGGDALRIAPSGQESVLELTHLSARNRRLVLTVSDPDPESSAQVSVHGRDLGRHALEDRTEIELPSDLPIGRVALTLGFSHHETKIDRIEVIPSHASGEVELVAGRIVQRGWSSVEVTRRVPAGALLRTTFDPPPVPEPGQRFTMTIERDGGEPETRFDWDADGAHSDGPVAIEEPLAATPGLVRVRFIAEGRGGSGSWLDPNVIVRRPETSPAEPTSVPEPPRLVIVYVMDALRADHVGVDTPAEQLTPIIDRLAIEGARFDRHFAVAPNTPPSTRALFSGLCMLDGRQLPIPGPTRLAENFRQIGYRTASITGNPHLSPDLDLAAGFDTVELRRVREDHHPKRPPTVNTSAETIHESALAWIDDLPSDHRGFLYLHTMNPHNPYTPPADLERALAPPGPSTIDGRTRTLVAIRDRQRDVSAEDIHRLRQLYAAGVAYNDRELGRLLTELERRYDPGEVLLVVTSDHGEELLEHDGVLHGYTLYDEMLRIPLVAWWPGTISPTTVSSMTSTLDLHTTLVELAVGTRGGSSGRSLWPALLDGSDAPDPAAMAFAAAPGLDGAVMARSDGWKLITAPRGGIKRGQGHGRGRTHDLEYVFDLATDPGELHNLAGIDRLETSWLRTRLAAWVELQRTLLPEPGGQAMNDDTKKQLEALGYIVE